MGLLEKAYAKHLGSFCQLEGCDYTHDAMRDLSSAPSFNHSDPKSYFKQISKGLEAGYLISGICSKGGDLEKDMAYPILQCAEVKGVQLVKLRNAWGKNYNGKWKNSSDEWPKDERDKLKVLDVDDGTFWACIEDFTSLQVCKYNSKFVF